jgi:hypothetical protein
LAVAAVAYLPTLLLAAVAKLVTNVAAGVSLGLIGVWALLFFSMLSQAVLVPIALEEMHGNRLELGKAAAVLLQRRLSVVGTALLLSVPVALGLMLLVVPGLILMSVWLVAMPVCVIDKLPPLASLSRSSRLTKTVRGKAFALASLLIVSSGIVTPLLEYILEPMAGAALSLAGTLLWNGGWGAACAGVVAVVYDELSGS